MAELQGPRASGRERGAAPKTYDRREVGRRGEDLAAEWYLTRGYRLLARNWRCRDGEIDLVLSGGPGLVFCEVKARQSLAFGQPAEAVGPLKQARVRRLAAHWIAAASGAGPRRGGTVRFDVASVLGGRVEVIEGAF